MLSAGVYAQTVQIGTGTDVPPYTLYSPIYRYSATSVTNGARSNIVYTQAELAAAGITTGVNITAIAFNKVNSANFVTPATFTVYMANSGTTPPLSTATAWSAIMGTHTQVFTSTSYNIPLAAGWVTIPLTPFLYTGGSLEIATELAMTGNGGATDKFQWEYTDGTANAIVGVASATGTTLNGAVAGYKYRPNIKITYAALAGCTSPPTGGTATADNTGTICPGTPVNLGLTGNSTGSGLTIEWERSASNTPFSPVSISTPQAGAALVVNPTATTWYRAKLVCNNGTPAYSTPVQVQVAGGLAGGTYTINSGAATGGTNYTSFADAVSALNCGITGPVVFNVVANSGPYVETVSFPNVSGTSAVNTIKINGNGNTVQFDNTSTNRQLLTISGTRYLKIDSLKFKALNTAYGWGALITNGAAYDSITRCTFDLSNSTATTTGNTNGICFSASATAATTAGNNGRHCYIGENLVKGPAGTGGSYYGIIVSGVSDSNVIRNNRVEDFYMYGIYIDGATGTQVTGNDVHRANKTSTTTFYGIYTTGLAPGTKITGNRIHDPGGTSASTSSVYNLYLAGDGTIANPVLVSNNAVYNATQSGTLYGFYVTSAPYNKIYHNTVDISQTLSGTSSNYGLYATGTNDGLAFRNNNVAITAGSGGSKYGFYYSAAASIDDAQRNNFYVNTTQSGTQSYGYYTTAYSDMAAFQAAYPALEVGSPNVDPQFAGAATGNLLPTNPMLYGTGQNLSAVVPADINGMVRAGTPTPGAFEMPLPPMNNAGTVARILPAGSVCPGVHPIAISIINAGQNILNHVQLHWQVNGVTQPAVTYTGPLAAATAPGGQNVDTVILGTATLTATAPTIIKAWTTQPNGTADTNNGNDTLSFTLNAAMNGTYTINSSNPTGGTNYNSFADFTADLGVKGVCGPVVAHVNTTAGPYVETVAFGTIDGASAVNTIKVNGHGATVQFTNTAANRQMLTLSGTKYVKIDSLNFKTLDASYGWAALVTNGSAYDSITNCTFNLSSVTTTASAGSSGICFSGSATAATTAGANGSHIYIGGNVIKGPTGSGGPYYGITVCGASDSNVIEKNLVENFYLYGIYVSGATGTKVKGNEVNRAGKTAVSTFYGIYTTGVAPGTLVTGNRIHSPGGTAGSSTSSVYAIYSSGDGAATNRNLIANNLVYNINQGGITYGIYGTGVVETDFIHNTIDFAVAIANTSTSTMYGIYVSGTNTNANVWNNNVSITGGNGGTKYGFYYVSASSVANADGNNFYVNSSQGGTQNYGYFTSAYTTLAAFQAAYPALEVGSVSEAPQYAAAAAGNFYPLNSNLFGNGSNAQALVPADINGIARSTTPTPGAYEIAAAHLNNTGAYALINPTGAFCGGPRPVQVSIINAGVNTINNAEIHWSVNGVMQPVVNYTGPLTGIYSNVNIDTVDLGTAVFPMGMPSVVKAWTRLPNGQADAYNANDTISITVQPAYSITVNLGNDTAICAQSSLTLNAGNPGATYLWSNGSTGQTLVTNAAGPYFVTVTAANGCKGYDTLNLDLTPLPVVNLGNDTAICPGSAIVLDAGNPGAAYLWDDGSIMQTRTAATEATYTVAVTANGCTATDAINVSLIDAPVADGINAVYGDTATYTFNVDNPQFAQTYTWDFGDGSPVATGMVVQHTYAHNGIYLVTLSMGGYCSGNTGAVKVTVDVFDAKGSTGIHDLYTDKDWLLYPNPAKDYIFVETQSGTAIQQVDIYTVTGQHVYNREAAAAKLQVFTSGWAPGLYLLKIQTAKGSAVRKFELLK